MRTDWKWESRLMRGYLLLSTAFMGTTLVSGFMKNEKLRIDELTVKRNQRRGKGRQDADHAERERAAGQA